MVRGQTLGPRCPIRILGYGLLTKSVDHPSATMGGLALLVALEHLIETTLTKDALSKILPSYKLTSLGMETGKEVYKCFL